jgi:uncharacterized protein
MPLFFKLLILLWAVNFSPACLAVFLEGKWNTPLDRGRLFLDGKPVFGPHKTVRGVLGGCGAGLAAAVLLGLPAWAGLCAGALSMAGDLLSSFLKRRLSLLSGDVAPILDQAPEAMLPFLVLAPYFSLSPGYVFAVFCVFTLSAYGGSVLLNRKLLSKPYQSYPRRLRAKTRLRELRSCQVKANALDRLLNWEDTVYYHLVMKSAFRLLGIFDRGKGNALMIEARRISFSFPDLPAAFDGYTILFLADLHLDGLEGLTELTARLVRHMDADLCIIGGDLRMETHGPFDAALRETLRLIPEVRTKDGILAVLGNHDCIEIVECLESEGVRYLINDSHAIERDGEKLWIAGADDPHYFAAHDLDLAFANVPEGAFTVFVAHSNEIYREVLAYGAKLYLCGHTHAGQIKLPRIGAVFTHSSAPRRFGEGLWSFGGMAGYTSRGVGVSGVPVRFGTKGEITLITLRRAGPGD